MIVMMVTRLLLLLLVWVSFAAATASLSTEETPAELCEAYCIEYHSELACPDIDIYSNALSSDKAPRKDPVDIPKCISACLNSEMRFDGTVNDFDNANTIQCRRNHIIMRIQQKTLSNSDHCLHAMIRGGQRCLAKDPATQYYNLLSKVGKELFWNPDSKLGLLIQSDVLKYGLAAVYEGSERLRLMTRYPYVEIPSSGRVCASPDDTRYRTVDGSCNRLEMPMMGATGTEFIQLFPPSKPHPDPLPDVADVAAMIKRPSVIDESRLAPFSQICVAWIQFMTHDWFQHGKDTTGNLVTHWWDGSMLYGSTQEEADNVRTADGKLLLDDDDEMAYDGNIPLTGFSLNWWAGLHVMHTIFAREHNYVVDQLELEYPGQYSVEEKFQIARLCVSALMAKIHTIEWTPTLLDNPGTSIGLNANWRGAEEALLDYGTQLEYKIGQFIVNGLQGYWVPYAGNTKAGTELTLFNTTFQMIEEFVAVYRMHPLLPDELTVGETTFSLNELTFKNPRNLVPNDTTEKFLRAFGETPAFTLSLQNYPRELYDLVTPGGTVNLAEIDLIRDRERGLPRYNDMRRLLLLEPYTSIDDLTNDSQEREALKSVYTDIEQVELMVGSLVDQQRPGGFAFGIIPFYIFLVFASRRILCDRFLMENFNAGLYTEWGYNHVQTETLRSVLVRHFPGLEDEMPDNPFLNWLPRGKK